MCMCCFVLLNKECLLGACRNACVNAVNSCVYITLFMYICMYAYIQNLEYISGHILYINNQTHYIYSHVHIHSFKVSNYFLCPFSIFML